MATQNRPRIPAPIEKQLWAEAAVVTKPGKQPMFKCAICGGRFIKSALERDHVKEWTDGGAHTLDNLQIICKPCHKAKTKKSGDRRRWRQKFTRGVIIGRACAGTSVVVLAGAAVWAGLDVQGRTAEADALLALYKRVGWAALTALVVVAVAVAVVRRKDTSPTATATDETAGAKTAQEERIRAWLTKQMPDSVVTVTWPMKGRGPTINVKYPPSTITDGPTRTLIYDKIEDLYPEGRWVPDWRTGEDRLILSDVPDPLIEPVQHVPMETIEEKADYSTVIGGVCDDSSPWMFRLFENHSLVAGATRSGKSAGFLWTIIRGVAPGIRAGHVKIHAIDPKGGVELGRGMALWDSYSDGDEVKNVPAIDEWYQSIEDAEAEQQDADSTPTRGAKRKVTVPEKPTPQDMHVALLEDAVEQLRDQLRAMKAAGIEKVETASTRFPLHIVIIDEAATVLSYASDSKLKGRAKNALEYLTSQGAAALFHVMCLAQDPSKETVTIRQLLPTRIALRLDNASQVRMVMGDGSVGDGARAHKIPRTMQGTGFVNSESNAMPVRFRTPFNSREDIAEMVRLYAPVSPGRPPSLMKD